MNALLYKATVTTKKKIETTASNTNAPLHKATVTIEKTAEASCKTTIPSTVSLLPMHVMDSWILPRLSVWSHPHRFGTDSSQRLCTFMSHAADFVDSANLSGHGQTIGRRTTRCKHIGSMINRLYALSVSILRRCEIR